MDHGLEIDTLRILNRHAVIFGSLLLVICLYSFDGYGTSLDKVQLQLKWYHQFQFAGYYAARTEGFFREEGLTVEIREGSIDQQVNKTVLEKNVEFGIQDGGDLIFHRLKGKPLVAVAAIFQHSPIALIARASSGIYSPSDLIGRTVMVDPFQGTAQILAMFRHEGIRVDSLLDQEPIRFKPRIWNLEDIVMGRVDAMAGYITSEPLQLRNRYDIETTIISPTSYGIDFYGDTLFTSRKVLAENPDMVERFRRASVKGWQFAMANPEKIVDTILALPTARKPRPDRETLLAEAEAMEKIVLAPVVEIGHMNPGRWKHMARIYQEFDMIRSVDNLSDFVYEKDYEKQQMREELRLLGIILGIVGLLAIIVLFWIKQLHYQVNIRTKALRESEDKFKYIFDYSIIGKSITDLSGKMQTNRFFCEMLGYSPEELRELTWQDIIHPDDIDPMQKIIDSITSGKQTSARFVKRLVHKKGSIVWADISTVLRRDSQGNPLYFFTSISDITELKKAENEILEYNERLKALREMDRAILTLRSPSDIMRNALNYARKLLPCNRASVIQYFPESGNGRILLVENDQVTQVERGVKVSMDNSGTGKKLIRGQTNIVQDLSTWPNLSPINRSLLAEGIRSYINVPIISRRGLIGSLNLGSKKPYAFHHQQIEIANEVAISLGVALQNSNLIEEVNKHHRELERYSARLVMAQEEERKRISLELHDEVGQALTAISFNLAAIRKVLACDIPPAVDDKIEDTASLVGQVADEIHELALTLRPSILDELGLVPSLRWLIRKFGQRSAIKTDFRSNEYIGRLSSDIEVALYRIVQEALNNVVKHANATHVFVRLKAGNGNIRLFVLDNGKGFDPTAQEKSDSAIGGIGLVGMRERVAFLGGTFRIMTKPKHGMRISINIPLQDEK